MGLLLCWNESAWWWNCYFFWVLCFVILQYNKLCMKTCSEPIFSTFSLELFPMYFFSLLCLTVLSFLKIHLGDSRSLQTNNGPLSVLPQTHANLSHVTINGDGLFSGVKAVARTGGVFLSPSNGKQLNTKTLHIIHFAKACSGLLWFTMSGVIYCAKMSI